LNFLFFHARGGGRAHTTGMLPWQGRVGRSLDDDDDELLATAVIARPVVASVTPSKALVEEQSLKEEDSDVPVRC